MVQHTVTTAAANTGCASSAIKPSREALRRPEATCEYLKRSKAGVVRKLCSSGSNRRERGVPLAGGEAREGCAYARRWVRDSQTQYSLWKPQMASNGDSVVRSWHGRDWQEYCILLLQKRFAATSPHNLQLVPDRHKGDLRIEAFSLDGAAYQCYAAEEPLTVEGCYQKQRDKLTTDLGKLSTYKKEMAEMLGTVSLQRYVFLVHRHDSRLLINHASKKAVEVVDWGLSFIDPGFRIVVETDDDYGVEREAIHALPAPLLEPEDISDDDRESWAAGNKDLRQTAYSKLQKIHTSSGTIDGVVETLTKQYLKGENTLERLRAISPEVHRGIIAARAQREELLALEYPPGFNDTQGKMVEISKEFAKSLLNDYPVLSDSMASMLAWSAVADWLMRCPLDFEDAS